MAEHQQARRQRKQSTKQHQQQKDGKIERQVWQQRIAVLKATEEQTQKAFREMLKDLPNYVDDKIIQDFPVVEKSKKASPILKIPSNLAIDHNPMYEMTLYERISDSAVAWTQQGTILSHALSQYILESFHAKYSNLSVWEIPHVMPLDNPNQQQFATDDTHTSNSWAVLASSTNISSQPFLDRQLPCFHLLKGPTNINTNNNGTWKDTHIMYNVHQENVAWYKQLVTDQYISILAIAGPNLSVDSRPLQVELVQQCHSIFRQLLLPESGRLSCIENEVSWKTVAVAAQDLQPYESSCLLLQVTPSNPSNEENKQTGKQRCKTLVSVSNLESYASSQLKHGNTKETLHVVLIQFAPMALILDWMVRAKGWDDSTLSFRVPPCLIPWTAAQESEEICFRRKILLGKNGKRSLKAMPTPEQTREKKADDVSVAVKQKTNTIVPREATSGRVTREQIWGETLSSPFGFLPFHNR